MRLFAIVALIVFAAAAQALAQSKPAKKPEPAAKAQPEKRVNTCAEYGAGFVRVEGTGTCVKVGGYMRMQGSTR
jgi:hypothetical protein